MNQTIVFEIQAVLDRDTKNLPGSPAIADTILEKISRANLFIADITLVTKSKRPSSNPNVLIELGYAAAKIGWERVICVLNDAFGEPRKLPFDLQHRRWPIRYNLSENATKGEIVKTKDSLSKEFELAIRSAIQSGVIVNVTHPKDRRVAV